MAYCEISLKNGPAARKARIERVTAYYIWARAGEFEVDYSEQGLPAPTIKELVTVKPKAGRPNVLSELDYNEIFAACTAPKRPGKSNNIILHQKKVLKLADALLEHRCEQ